MVIAPRTPKRTGPGHKKRTGQHQKQTKHYMKTYWPYLPLLAITLVANGLLQDHVSGSNIRLAATMIPATRLQFWTHASNNVIIAIGLAVFAVAVYVVVHHARAWHRVLVKGEDFVVQHQLVDVGLVSLVLVGIIVTRSV